MNTMTLRQAEPLARDTRLVFQLLEKLQDGMLEIRLPDGSSRLFGNGEHGVTLNVSNEAMFSAVLAKGDIGLAEAYLDGYWDASDITGCSPCWREIAMC
jgi:cyclopropane-fatty-acyl-phospholipid synthase